MLSTMKPTSVVLLSVAGMLLTSVSVYSLTPTRPAAAEVAVQTVSPATRIPEVATFRAGSTLALEGRMGHGRVAAGPNAETLLLLEVRGSDSAAAAPPAVNLALVIDRSGSMRGGRLQHATAAAVAAAARLRDGDVVSVIAFDTKTSVVLAPTTIGPYDPTPMTYCYWCPPKTLDCPIFTDPGTVVVAD